MVRDEQNDTQQELAVAKNNVATRHRLWSQRRKGSTDFTSWKPLKRYRVASKHCLLAVDNQIKYSLGLSGWADFVRVAEGPAAWGDWRAWPHMLGAMDQGPDNVCSSNWLLHIGVNLTRVWDWSHGVKCDFDDLLRTFKLSAFWKLMLVAVNVEHGPKDEEARYDQLKEAWKEMKTHFTSKTCAVFLDKVSGMIEEH
eukprot:660891-Pyramimonas_sp.AAC.1